MPTFSIVLPTTRPHLLRYSLQSALRQDFDDFEVVVVDNCSEGADEVINEYPDKRIRRVASPRRLSMVDNWELGLTYAKGEYVTYLCDDDAIVPQLLSVLSRDIQAHQDIKVFRWAVARYWHHTWPDQHLRGRLQVPGWTGHRHVLQSAGLLRQAFREVELPRYFPLVQYGCYHREIIATVTKTIGRFFLPLAPDISSGAAVLANAKEEMWLDLPLSLVGRSVDSNVAMVRNPKHFLGFLREFNEEVFQEVQVRIPTLPYNTVAETLLNVRKALGTSLNEYELDATRYFELCLFNIRELERAGWDVEDYWREFYRAIARQPHAVQYRVKLLLGPRMLLLGRSSIVGRPLRRLARSCRSVLGIGGKGSRLVKCRSCRKEELRGARNGPFQDILEGTRALASLMNASRL